jgi:hypothetical protein
LTSLWIRTGDLGRRIEKMAFEKTIILDSGDKVNIRVEVYISNYASLLNASYRMSIRVCKKGKRTFIDPIDSDSYIFRALSMEARALSIKNQIINMLGRDVYNSALLDAWQSLKPQIIV